MPPRTLICNRNRPLRIYGALTRPNRNRNPASPPPPAGGEVAKAHLQTPFSGPKQDLGTEYQWVNTFHPDRPFVAHDPIISAPHVQSVYDRFHQRRIRFRPGRARLKVLGATDVPTGCRPTPDIRRRSVRFCRQHTSIKRNAYSQSAMFRPSATGARRLLWRLLTSDNPSPRASRHRQLTNSRSSDLPG